MGPSAKDFHAAEGENSRGLVWTFTSSERVQKWDQRLLVNKLHQLRNVVNNKFYHSTIIYILNLCIVISREMRLFNWKKFCFTLYEVTVNLFQLIRAFFCCLQLSKYDCNGSNPNAFRFLAWTIFCGSLCGLHCCPDMFVVLLQGGMLVKRTFIMVSYKIVSIKMLQNWWIGQICKKRFARTP